ESALNGYGKELRSWITSTPGSATQSIPIASGILLFPHPTSSTIRFGAASGSTSHPHGRNDPTSFWIDVCSIIAPSMSAGLKLRERSLAGVPGSLLGPGAPMIPPLVHLLN